MRNQEEELNDSWRILPSKKIEFNPAYLELIGEGILASAERTIQKGCLEKWASPRWYDGKAAIFSLFGLERYPHFFNSKPIVWARFHEPQITKGFAHFLTNGSSARNQDRTGALLKVLGVVLPSEIYNLSVEAEYETNNQKRIDLLVQWENSDNVAHAVVIEAKFGHVITTGQLPKYRNYIRDKITIETKLDILQESPKRSEFFVVAPDLNGKSNMMLKRNSDWKMVTWHTLLIAYQRAVPVEADCEEFRRFRRTVWHRV